MHTVTPESFIKKIIKKYGENYTNTEYWRTSGNYSYSALCASYKSKKKAKPKQEVLTGKCPIDTICGTCGQAIKKESEVKKIGGVYHHFKCR